MPKLQRKSKDITVRPLKKSDYKVWRTCYETMKPSQNPWDVVHRSGNRLSLQAFQEVVESKKSLIKQDRQYVLSVFENKSGALVGGVSALDIIRGITQSAFLGYWMHNDYWGMGYGKQAAKAMLDIGFRDILLHRMEAGVEPNNRRSIMMARSLGLRKEGLKKRMIFLRDEWQDLIIYSATCEDFKIPWKGQTSPVLKRKPAR